jgi:hypothetical protein
MISTVIHYWDIGIHLLTPVGLIVFILWLRWRRHGGLVYGLRVTLWRPLRYVWLALAGMLFIYQVNNISHIIPQWPQPSTSTLITLGAAAAAIRKLKP